MKRVLTTLVASTVLFSQSIQADINTDANQIFNDAQKVYSELFPSNQKTQTLEPWLFRFYSKSGIYLGVNKEDSGVYLLGGTFGTSPVYIDQTDQILSMLNAKKGITTDGTTFCNLASIPEGISYQQNNNTISLSTNGQCIKLPEIASKNYCDVNPSTDSSGIAITTGINVLIQSNVQDFEITGLLIDLPESATNALFGTKVCLINAPYDFTSYHVNNDLCIDMTDQLLSANPSIISYSNLPITLRYKSSAISTIVSDCFATDADAISDAVTGEVWTKNEDSSFMKIN